MRAQDDRRPLSLIVLDCDDFKDVNDRAGHELGDALLREIGTGARACVPGGRLRGEARGRRVRRHAARLRCRRRLRRRGGAPAPARRRARRCRLPAPPQRRLVDLSVRRCRCVPAPPRRRSGPLPGQVAREEPRDRLPRRRASAKTGTLPPIGVERGRASGVDGSMLVDAMDASAAIWAEDSVDGVLERLEQVGHVRRRCDGSAHLEGRGGTARRRGEALDARHRPR